MGHVLLRSWQLRAAVLSITTLCFAVLAATAGAVTVTSNSGATVCTNAPTGTNGNCTFSGNGSAAFTGNVVQPAPVDPSLCGPQSGDQVDFICGHFGLNFNNVSGSVTVTITGFDTDRVDLDLCIADSTGVIVLCTTGTGSTETITFTVGCTDTRYEALIVPTDTSFMDPPLPTDPVSYSGGATANLTSCLGGTGSGGGTKAAAGHKVTGGGQTGFATTATGNFSLNVIATGSGFKGKVQTSDATCTFRGTQIDAVSWNDATRDARIAGRGSFKNAPNTLVTFTAEAQDNGQGDNAIDPDFFTIDKCSGGGQVVHGNITYHSS
jgi:hypothetical protein